MISLHWRTQAFSNGGRWLGSPRKTKAQCTISKEASASSADQETRRVESQVEAASESLRPVFSQIDRVVARNSSRLQRAYTKHGVNELMMQGSRGTDMSSTWTGLDGVIADCMGTEAAICRLHILSGTHAIAAALFSCLGPGDELLAVAGEPYDTLEEVIGTRGESNIGNLADFGVTFRVQPLTPEGHVDIEALNDSIHPGVTRVCHIQRSCGYTLRPTMTVADIGRVIAAVRVIDPTIVCTVDNCYGEFTEETEPGHVGADLVMGSLIKNPGGTLVTGGGYVAGRTDLVERVATRIGAPGIDLKSVPLSGRQARSILQGLYLAPQFVGEALKGGRLVAQVMADAGYTVTPDPAAPVECPSFITSVTMGSEQAMVDFCQAVQSNSPVGAYIQPTPGQTPGYESKVIFADGTFVDGSTAELSADGPLRDPYVVYCQGGVHWTHWSNVLVSVMKAL